MLEVFYYNNVILAPEKITKLREKKDLNMERLNDGLAAYNLENSTPMIDVPTHEEVLTKKPDYDKVSTPTPQIFDEDCQSKSLDKDNTPSDNLQQGIQTITSKDPSNFKSL